MPSRANTSATSALDSGSSGARSRSATSSTVTRTPNREKACAISAPIAPPPITISEAGRSASRTASRFVQYGVPARPSIGGADGSVPVFSTTPRLAMYVVPSDLHGPRAGEPGRTAHERDARVHEPVDGHLVVPVGGGLVADPDVHRRPVRRHRARRPPGPRPAGPRPARRRPGSSSCSGCSRSRGTRRRPAGGPPRRPTGRPARAGWPPTPRPARARRPPRPPAGSQKSCRPACHPRQAPAPRLLAWLTARTTTTTTPATPRSGSG